MILHLCTNNEVSAMKRCLDFPSERKCNQEVTGWLTFCLKEQYAASFCRSRFKYEVRSLNTQHLNSYSSYKNVLFMGQSDLDPRTIDLNIYGNLPIKILYQYAYVTHLERLNYGTITTCLIERVLHIDARLRRNKSKVLSEMTSREHQYIEKK